MKRVILPCALTFSILSCSPTTGREVDKTAVTIATEKTETQSNFDLAGLSFKRPVEELLKPAGITASEGASEASTLAGFVVFQSSSPKLLLFDGQSLSEKNEGTKNTLLLHYAERTNLVDAYELLLFNPQAAEILENRLKRKLGKPVFSKDSAENPAAMRLDENGDVKTGPREDISYQRWEDKKNDLSYHLVKRKKAQVLEAAELTVINMKSGNEKNWLHFKMLDFYYK